MNKLYIECERNAISNADYLFYLTCLGTLSRCFSPSYSMLYLSLEEEESILLLNQITAK